MGRHITVSRFKFLPLRWCPTTAPVGSPGLVSWAKVAPATPADDREGQYPNITEDKDNPMWRCGVCDTSPTPLVQFEALSRTTPNPYYSGRALRTRMYRDLSRLTWIGC